MHQNNVKHYCLISFYLRRVKHSLQKAFSFLLFIIFFLISTTAQAAIDKQAGWHEQYIAHDGQRRYFRYYIPPQLKAQPEVVLLFHGGTQSMRKIMRKRAGGSQEWQTLADQNGFLLLTPNGVNVKTGDSKGDKQNWNDCRIAVKGNNSASSADDVGFVNQLLDWAQTHFEINPARIYATGASNGGLMSLRLITELSNRITAAAVFIANQPEKTDCKKPERAVPLLMMSATEDPLMLWQGGQIRDEGPVLMSAPATRDYWLQVNRVNKKAASSTQLADINKKDGSVIIKTIYPATAQGQPVWFYEIRDAGHTMPSIKHKVPFFARMLVGSQNKDIESSHEA
jgi:polyhydroxybutyrate depolymerase